MAVEAVKNYSVGFQQPHKMNLKSQQSFTSAPEVDEEKSNAAKYMIGATALAAVVGLGIAGYKGKLGKGIQKFLGGAEKAAENSTEEVAENAAKKSEEIADGAQRKAKQYIVNGEPYTGVRDTGKAEITYIGGYIRKSKLSDGTVKDYYRDANGFIENISVEKPDEYTLKLWKENDGTIRKTKELHRGSPDFKLASGRKIGSDVFIKYDTTITPDGNIRKVKIENYPFSNKDYRGGKKFWLKREIDLVSGKSKTSHWYSYNSLESLRPHKVGHWDEHKVIDGIKYSVCYDDHGKISSACHGSYNPKTGVITKKYYEMKDGNLVPTSTEQIDKKTKLRLRFNVESGDVVLYIGRNPDIRGTFDTSFIRDRRQIQHILDKHCIEFDMSHIYW